MNHRVISHLDSFNLIVEKLRGGKSFTFTRFGDADYIIMYPSSRGKRVGNSNHFMVTKELQKEIIKCHNIKDEDFLIGSVLNDESQYIMKPYNTKINKSFLPPLDEHEWVLAMSCLQEILLTDPEKFLEFPREMRKTNTMLVGSYNHGRLSQIFGEIDIFIEVPQRNCYSTINDWYGEILKNKDKVGKIVLAAGQSSRVIAGRLWKSDDIIIDVGSLGDMFVLETGIKIPLRTHIKKDRERINRNVFEVLENIK
ncbi:MAG: hypothetical protein ACYSYU_03880 [Planctomycetota bacterium]|jgi:hypothetical protein